VLLIVVEVANCLVSTALVCSDNMLVFVGYCSGSSKWQYTDVVDMVLSIVTVVLVLC